jgi:hypothetical protein
MRVAYEEFKQSRTNETSSPGPKGEQKSALVGQIGQYQAADPERLGAT